MPKYSVVIPVYNRPIEIKELLNSLVAQTQTDFEVLIIEDGSKDSCQEIVKSFHDQLDIEYFFKENSGQGFSRNYGVTKAKGDWLIFFDSDCVIPDNYLFEVDQFLENNSVDAFSGPDASSASFSPFQKAISYSMTSLLTTGGIRGKKKNIDKFELRSFNLGMKKQVFDDLKGFGKTNMGEDIELSFRAMEAGYNLGLAPKALVYHKRRDNGSSFFKQLFSFGRTRIQLKRGFSVPMRLVHFLPAVFVLGLVGCWILKYMGYQIGSIGLRIYFLYFVAIFLASSGSHSNFLVGALSVFTSFTQFVAYGFGFWSELISSLPGRVKTA